MDPLEVEMEKRIWTLRVFITLHITLDERILISFIC